MSAPQNVLFVGIGNMGWPMAARLLGAGFAVAVNDAVPGRAADFVRQVGGAEAADLATAAPQANVVITMLPTSKHVGEAVAALRAGLKQGQILIDMSSGAPAATQAIAADLAPLGVTMLDAPVSGGVPRAKTGELAIMAGGDAAALDRVEPLLRAMGTTIHRIGGLGSGQAMKALNNLVSAGGFLIGIEALLIGQQFGIDPALMTDVLNASTGMNNSTQKKFKQFVLSRQFNSGFGLDLMVKDLSIALEIARAAGVAAPFSNLCRELSASAQGLLGPGQDHTALAKLSEALAGVELGGEPSSHSQS
ncbi:Putative hydroxyacid dehydrogenase/reductase; putative 2-hydroxy-3-oxopropionate reductase [Bradyrhizobium sp. ORS 285]|uniref:NAD(P)-dependent oxidoreductase n=1 Tax=Bradyrhizobium sp. ORS 285 TaxID=115808 RepID=UPI0002407979|nr:NAD(P)-dependent oxidoreductase [Bradyrhizobium sp. ORS 285]CCD89646.1 putative hydroxyacid dehydrogenase/reductase; 3-hydroxyisobutyrate dehydrogenase [Bradyrhizobium sp. ORS 285]SMX56325.1 Putative hydroxyacid dehydrogenase/reductase; putative 2-hydroxy-3-oxopropionate reductase [Bradyrhizobium sp. ORS 285]